MPPKAILLDIEGTICPISFVQETLFPHALRALGPYLDQNWTSPSFAPLLASFPEAHTASPAALIAHVEQLTASDTKLPALKALQGALWRDGYASGEIVAPIYADVVPAIATWRRAGARVWVYSSGSVQAQELFFEHSVEGDVRGLFEGFFDTGVGAKREAGSYARIAAECGADVGGWVFLSDSVAEVRAAVEAGMRGGVVVREGNAPLGDADREEFWVVEGGFGEVAGRVFGE